MGVEGLIAVEPQAVLLDPISALALLAEAGLLELADHRDGEGVIDLHNVHVFGTNAGQSERLTSGATDRADRDPADVGEVAAEDAEAAAQDVGGRLPHSLGNVRSCDHERAAASAGHDAFEQVQRVRDDPRLDDVIDTDW